MYSSIIKILLTIATTCIVIISYAQKSSVDSLQTQLIGNHNDTTKITLLLQLGKSYMATGSYDSSLLYIKKALELATEVDYKKGVASAYQNIGTTFYYLGDYNLALKNYIEALKINEKIGSKKGIATSYNNLGLIYQSLGKYTDAMSNHEKSLDLRMELGDTNDIAASFSNIAIVWALNEDFEKAGKHFHTALDLYIKVNNVDRTAATYNNIGSNLQIQGVWFQEKGNFKEAESNFSLAFENYFSALKIQEDIGAKRSIAMSQLNIGGTYYYVEDYDSALIWFGRALQLALEIKDKVLIKGIYNGLADVNEKRENYKEAYQNHQLYTQYNDSIYNENSSKQIAEMQTKYESEKKESENKLLIKDNALKKVDLNRQQLIIYGIGIVLILVSVSMALVFVGYKRKKKTNLLLERKNEAIEIQKNIIGNKNIQITESIDYAKKIQDAILPSIEEIKKNFSDVFIFYLPKDIVSGDFYWYHDTEKYCYLSAVDCTGHGVPGAFMSLMVFNLLEKIIKQLGVSNPAEILDTLNIAVLETLKQSDDKHERVAEFGMDMSFVRIDKASKQLEFAGAYNPVYIVNDMQLTVLKADRMAIGTKKQFVSNFSNQTHQLQDGDKIYLFSDGYADQGGGEYKKRFYSSRLKTLLTENSNSPMNEQQQLLLQNFIDWKGLIEQYDDVLIIGLQV